MNDRTFRRVTVSLPGIDDGYLSNVASLDNPRGIVQEFRYADADLRALELADTTLTSGRISAVRAERVRLEEVRADSVEFEGCDLGSAQWSDSKLSRVVFRDCKLMGATLTGLTLDNVLFDGCKLDFATFAQVRAIGPIVFSKCTLTEATFTGCDLNRAVIDASTLRRTEFERGSYRELDLRGNDLSEVRGTGNLAKVILDRGQEAELARALITELEVVFGEDLDDPARGSRR
ncbi:pentapeptide repeat-containing protein [Kitasatospora sp. NPDC048545]|uniref:pentapeptide repeat-containing protein n=1 Tax=Kitasatospora sp. NPDC048545 TaxID=3157208 RepID=UPI0034055678